MVGVSLLGVGKLALVSEVVGTGTRCRPAVDFGNCTVLIPVRPGGPHLLIPKEVKQKLFRKIKSQLVAYLSNKFRSFLKVDTNFKNLQESSVNSHDCG